MNLPQHEIDLVINEFGPTSTKRFYDEIRKIKDGILVELGVYLGASSRLMISNCKEDNNQVIGIDPIPYFNSPNSNYKYIQEDSVQMGKVWDCKADLVLFDSVHAKEQVLCELFYWWDHIKKGGLAVFHDTSWEGYVHKEGHSCAGKLTGNTGLGYDTYGGIDWETPDKAVEEFFGIVLNTPERDISKDEFLLVYEDENIKVETNYACLGMTLIQKKTDVEYKDNIQNWEEVFDRQKILLSHF